MSSLDPQIGSALSVSLAGALDQPALGGAYPPSPRLPHMSEPLLERGETGGIGLVDAPLRLGPHAEQRRGAKDLEMLGNGRGRDLEAGSDLAGRELALGEELDDAAAGRIRERGEAVHETMLGQRLV